MPGEERPDASSTGMLYVDIMNNPCPAAHAQLTQGMLSAGINKDEIFTTNPRETPVHIVAWGFLGEAFPFFKPNFTKMEEYGRDMGADEVQPTYTGPLHRLLSPGAQSNLCLIPSGAPLRMLLAPMNLPDK